MKVIKGSHSVAWGDAISQERGNTKFTCLTTCGKWTQVCSQGKEKLLNTSKKSGQPRNPLNKQLFDYLHYFAVLQNVLWTKGTGINRQDLKHGLSKTYTEHSSSPLFLCSLIISNSLFVFMTTVESWANTFRLITATPRVLSCRTISSRLKTTV